MSWCIYNFVKFPMCIYNFNVAFRISTNLDGFDWNYSIGKEHGRIFDIGI